jgi:anhydro-N-acetylmuramic acid kinase
MSDNLYIGLLSGTSRDGVDAVLARIEKGETELIAARCEPYPQMLRTALEELMAKRRPPSAEENARLDLALGDCFADSVLCLLDQAGCAANEVRAIGSHGQTVWHQPDDDPPVTIQLGNADIIAQKTGITTVADFRQADLLAGGQGAPLAPLLHRRLFQSDLERRVVLNLGGIANLTLLEPDGSVSGFDSGPGNCLLDAWINHKQNLPFDEDGKWSASGWTYREFLMAMMADPYFALPPPKSTGVELFNLEWLQGHLPDPPPEPADIQATLAELTAYSVVEAMQNAWGMPDRLLICGGGVHNTDLKWRLRANMDGQSSESTAEHGVDPDWVEGLLFAWLAQQRLAGIPQDTRDITGASEPVLLGQVHEPGKIQET